MRITQHFCDFNVNLQNHEAHVVILARGAGVDKDDLQLDACVDHFAAMAENLITSPDKPAKEVCIKPLSHLKALPQKKASGSKKQSCPLCGVVVVNLYSHAKTHGLKNTAELREAAELRIKS